MVVGEIGASTGLLVIGAGPGGYAAALRGAALGLEVTLVERDRVGGVCLNVGCIPSKVLIHAAETAALAARSAAWGVKLTAKVDMKALGRHMAEVVEGLTSGVSGLLRDAGVTVVSGQARFTRPDRVIVEHEDHTSFISFENAVLATGSRPVELPALAFDGARVLDSTGALALERAPRRLVVVGGGYIGVELGTAFAKLGSAVTIVEAADRLLPGLDASLARAVARRLEELGVVVLTRSSAVELTEAGLLVAPPDGPAAEVAADKVVVAVGRRPNTDDLGLEHTGAKLDPAGLVQVAPSRRAARTLLAIGDVTAGPALAHKATAESAVAAETAARRTAAFDPACIPAVVFSDPELATVGLTRDAAKAAGADVRAFRFPLSASSRARTLGDSHGHVEVIADGDGTVLGVHIAGPNASELAGEAALAVEMAVTLDELAEVIHPHPSLSEAIGEAALGALGRPLHVRGARRPSPG
ncbi:MAG: dihydrolipoyl dehydrogenase [Acidimicrobiales bacterium]